MKFIVYEQADGSFLLKQERESWQLPFPSVAAAIDGVRKLPVHAEAVIVVMGTNGRPRMQFRL